MDGVRIVDLSGYLAGPFCTMILGDMGAEVIKVEEPSKGDGSRRWGPPFINGESVYFMSVNRNKKSITLNLKNQVGVQILKKLVRKADVFVENYRAGTTRGLGIDYPQLSQLNPKLIYCSISGYGQEGPLSDKPAYDLTAQAMGGVMSLTGYEDGPPAKVGIAIGDLAGGLFATIGILAALRARTTTDNGQFIDISLMDSQVALLTFQAGNYLNTGEVPKRLGTAHPNIAPYQAFVAGDGSYFVIAVGNDSLWVSFCEATGLTHLVKDRRFATNPDRVSNREELARILTKHFSSEPAKHWLQLIDDAGVPCAPINTLNEVFDNEQTVYRKTVREIQHPKAGKVKVVGPAVRMTKTNPEISHYPPILGEHTKELLRELGYSTFEIDQMRSDGVI